MPRTLLCECGECPRCKHRVYMRSYYRRPGVSGKTREMVARYRAANIDVVRQRDRARGFRVYDEAKVKARRALNHAVATGKVIREDCEQCGAPNAHAHHDDHSRPLDVRWLCSACHGIEHRRF